MMLNLFISSHIKKILDRGHLMALASLHSCGHILKADYCITIKLIVTPLDSEPPLTLL